MPLEMIGYQEINGDKSAQGLLCYLETASTVRYFVQGSQRYYRLGDLLCLKAIVNVFRYSGDTTNFLFFWSSLCRHSHVLLTNKMKSRRKKKVRKTKGGESIHKELKMKACAENATHFTQDVVDAMDEVGLPINPQRSL